MALMLTLSNQPQLLSWAGSVIVGNRDPAAWGVDARAMACLERGTNRIMAVMVINSFFEDSCYLHIASNEKGHWAQEDIVAGMFAFIFGECGVDRIIGVTPSDKLKAITLLIRLGFTIEGRIRSTSDGKRANIVSTMFREECRYLAPQGVDHG